MAGKSRPLTHRFAAAAAGLLLAASAALSSSATKEQDERADVLLARRPDRFVLYNKYQQRLTATEAAAIPSCVPIMIVREKDNLGDGVTPCAVVEIRGERFYLLRDQDGELAGKQEAGPIEFFRGVEVLRDTIVLRQALSVTPQYPSEERARNLSPETILVRVFRAGARTFVASITPSPLYGWMTLPAADLGKKWEPHASASPRSLTPKAVYNRLLPLVASANSALRSMYTRFSANSSRRDTIPEFSLAISRDTVFCVVEPAGFREKFSRSVRNLHGEFESMLSGSNARLSLVDNRILITFP
jgi:hypothetical protein